MREAFAIGSALCAAGAATLLTRRATRVEIGRSRQLEARAAQILSQSGYHGTPDVTVNRKEGRAWAVTGYQPSARDQTLDPADHGREISRLIADISKQFPKYHWTDRAHYYGAYILTIAGIALAAAAAISPS